jgi:hypothetical protein
MQTRNSVVGGEIKSNITYETLLRLTPFLDLKISQSEKDDIDVDTYSKLVNYPPVTVAGNFDLYRTLRNNLQTAGVSSRDASSFDATGGSAGEQQLLPTLNENGKVITIPAVFPKTFKRSSLGLGLTESQSDMRLMMLNTWVGCAFSLCDRMPEDAQQLIKSFIGFSDADRLNNAGGNEQSAALIEFRTGAFAPIWSILMNKFRPPLNKAAAARLGVVAGQEITISLQDVSHKGTGAGGVVGSSSSSKNNTPFASGVEVPEDARSGLEDADVARYMGEHNVNGFLASQVVRGEKVAKTPGDTKLHTAYEVSRGSASGELSKLFFGSLFQLPFALNGKVP